MTGTELFVKRFNELTLYDLYDILKLRAEVFVQEQNCPYVDPDGMDPESLHVFYRDDGKLAAYLRICPKGTRYEAYNAVTIGRVISKDRGQGHGKAVVLAGIKAAKEMYPGEEIVLAAQSYAEGFYVKCGFTRISDVFYEDGIPHIMMKYKG